MESVFLLAVERGATLPGQGQLPVPPVLDSDHTAALAMVIALYAGFAAAVVWAVVKLVREREVLPAVLVVSGLIACNAEPVGDYVGQIVYAPDIPWFDYEVLGRQMPSFILVGLASYVAMGGYYAYRYIADGRSLRDIAVVCVVWVGVPEIAMEMLWHHWSVIAYYGDNPTRILGVPLYTIVQNSTLLPVYGVAVYLGARYLKGWSVLWMVVVMPTVTIGYIVGVSWPVYQAIGSSADAWVVWVCAAWVVVASVAASYAALQLPELRELRRRRAEAAEAVPARGGAAPVAQPAEAL
ncbi:hypothetical protein [Conexibacter sp. SYSU D00693]|uniref:hypothetical protein n=1 Tax=Conexibacter sp. SYSU D00693 TaxID=2812560 RepID=UPI00196A85C9|nr:hypothetical protein [Conexibacter sp. SYSU D00693]